MPLPVAPPQQLLPLPAAPARATRDAPPALPAGLQPQPSNLELHLAAPGQAIDVATEQQLRAALVSADLGWRDRRAVQLTADIQLSAPLLINGPARLQGSCGSSRSRCRLQGSGAARPLPLLLISGPAAIVELANLELSGGVGSASLAGGLTASNHSMVDLVGVRLTGNSAASGGGARVDSHARLGMTGCEVDGNMAQVRQQLGMADTLLSCLVPGQLFPC